LLPDGVQLYDLIYNPPVTRLMQAARDKHGRAVNGLGMLVRQAALAFNIWTGVEPSLEVMFEAVRA
jgi:shikimate dehydrogenase